MLSIFKKSREFIVDEKDVTAVISVINEHRIFYDTRVGNCGWADEPDKWFIVFSVNDKRYGEIVKDLKGIGKFNLDIRPGGQVDIRFERAK